MVAQPKPEPFITEELVELVKSLEGVINNPHFLPTELREIPHWLKVQKNKRGHWKQPCIYSRGKLTSYNWNLGSYHLALDKVLNQEPPGKAGFHARDRLCVIDLDDVIDGVTRQLKEPKILELLNTLKASVYLSSSGTGLHIPFRLQEGVEIDPPGKNLSFRDTEGGTGQFLGGKYPSFVAFTGVAVPRYDYGWLVEITQAEWNYIREFLWSVETVTYTEPSEPIPLAAQASTPQARAPREPEPKESPFGIKWKPNYRSHVESVFNGFDDPREESDTSTSGRCNQWISLYIRGAEHWTYDQAVQLSKQVEGFYLSKQTNPRNKKRPDWHEANVIKLIKKFTESSSLIYLSKHDLEGKKPVDEQLLQATRYAQGTGMKPTTQAIFLMIVSKASGRDRFKLSDSNLADAVDLHRTTVIRAKKELANFSFLKINGNIYTFL
ncbi:MAG: hypothetical protein O2921_08210 [Chloroflexi bacterium]|nr:hypothetical protein [Chloroflexota bacterium]MDA1282588.1 hypothetical protein [Chloroflexota bacterium]